MAVSKHGTSRCGLCRFYAHEGRRGGRCSQLNVAVESNWKACSLAVSPFGDYQPPSNLDMAGIDPWNGQGIVRESRPGEVTASSLKPFLTSPH